MSIFDDIRKERGRQIERFGIQQHPNGTGRPGDKEICKVTREVCDIATKLGKVTWRQILQEEISEAFAETDAYLLREELVQSAAVIVAWIEHLDKVV